MTAKEQLRERLDALTEEQAAAALRLLDTRADADASRNREFSAFLREGPSFDALELARPLEYPRDVAL